MERQANGIGFPTRTYRTRALGIRAALRGWLERVQARNELNALSLHYLHDIGIEKHDIAEAVDREVGKLRADEFRSRG